MIKTFAEDKTGEWLAANSLPDACFIRPSGNPIPSTQFATFLAGDVCITEKNLIKIQKLDVGTDMAFACVPANPGSSPTRASRTTTRRSR